jgi:putative FmdB family regulatory protein
MPIYEYRCEKDGHTFEVMQRFSDDPVETCEVCGAPVQRVFHPVAVHFKGKGFYNTDYGTRKRARELKDESSSSKTDSSSSGDSSGKESKSSDSKPSDSKSSDAKSSGSKSESTKAAA